MLRPGNAGYWVREVSLKSFHILYVAVEPVQNTLDD